MIALNTRCWNVSCNWWMEISINVDRSWERILTQLIKIYIFGLIFQFKFHSRCSLNPINGTRWAYGKQRLRGIRTQLARTWIRVFCVNIDDGWIQFTQIISYSSRSKWSHIRYQYVYACMKNIKIKPQKI